MKTLCKNYKELCQEIQKRNYKNLDDLYCETTEDEYWYFLEILPPIKYKTGFLLSESLSFCEDAGSLSYYHHFWRENGKYHSDIIRHKYII